MPLAAPVITATLLSSLAMAMLLSFVMGMPRKT
jgi:hypothetical protein